MRFETPCIFQSPSEKQQPEIIYTILCLRSETLTATHLLLQIELNSALTLNAAKKGQSRLPTCWQDSWKRWKLIFKSKFF